MINYSGESKKKFKVTIGGESGSESGSETTFDFDEFREMLLRVPDSGMKKATDWVS